MRTLTEAFAPGSPSLPEGLRTLVVSPDRTVEPGTTVRVSFTFNNVGGAAATGLRVRFALPEGLRYLVGSARIDDALFEEARGETQLLAPNGADIGEVPPGVERRISLAYHVNPTIENGATIVLQAALSSLETGIIGSNVVRLDAQSQPTLDNPETFASIEAVRVAEPGEEVRVAARVFNAGQSSARDVIVVLPVPNHTRYVPGSARIDGRDVPHIDDRDDDPFGDARAPVAVPVLAAGATLVVEYRARIESPLDNNTRIFAGGEVVSAETPEFSLARAELTVTSAARFDGTTTALVVDAPNDVEPGRRIRIMFAAKNVGTCAASDVRIRLTIPEGLQYAPGSRAIDGRAAAESDAPGAFAFERIAADESVEVAVDAYVVSPIADGAQLPLAGTIQWATGSRSFDRTLSVRSKPRFAAGQSALVLDGPSAVAPGAEVHAIIRIVNDGTAPATSTAIAIEADAALESLRFRLDGDEARVQNGQIALGELAAGAHREIVLSGTVASPIADRTEIRLQATLLSNETPALDLGTVTLAARSRPRFSTATSHLTFISGDPLRPSGAGDIAIVIANDGTDVARDVRLALELAPDARIESVEGATRSGQQIIFGDIPPGARSEALLRVRLASFVRRGTVVTVRARLAGAALLPFALEPVTIETRAEPNFSDGARLRTQPVDSVDAGEAMFVQLAVRNTGDGSASRVVIRAALPEHTAYILGSTSINDVPLLDTLGGSVLWSKPGLVLEDVDPGVEVVVRYAAIVNTPLAAGTLIAPVAELHWDGGHSLRLGSAAVRVRSAPAFNVRASGLPFSVAGVAPRTADVLHDVAFASPMGIVPPAPGAMLRSLPAAPLEPPAAPATPQLPAAARQLPPLAVDGEPRFATHLTLTRDELERALAFLESSDYGGLITHLFALRTLFPDGVYELDDAVDAKFAGERDALRGVVDRLFIKMRMPRRGLTGSDLEDRTSRAALVDLLAALRDAEPAASAVIAPEASGAVVIAGALDRERVTANLAALESEPLGGARPWLVLAELVGSTISWPGGSSDVLDTYRSTLIASLTSSAALPVEEFHRVLAASSSVVLDTALADVRTVLRGALEATATAADRV